MICVDVLSNRKLLSLLLGKRKVLTEMAEDGADVLAMAKDGRLGRFNLIFMDNQMPKMVTIGSLHSNFPILILLIAFFVFGVIVWDRNGSAASSPGLPLPSDWTNCQCPK